MKDNQFSPVPNGPGKQPLTPVSRNVSTPRANSRKRRAAGGKTLGSTKARLTGDARIDEDEDRLKDPTLMRSCRCFPFPFERFRVPFATTHHNPVASRDRDRSFQPFERAVVLDKINLPKPEAVQGSARSNFAAGAKRSALRGKVNKVRRKHCPVCRRGLKQSNGGQ